MLHAISRKRLAFPANPLVAFPTLLHVKCPSFSVGHRFSPDRTTAAFLVVSCSCFAYASHNYSRNQITIMIEPEAFEDDPRLHTKFGYHVQVIYYVASVVTVIIDLLPIVFGLLLFLYAELHRLSPLYTHFLMVYDRTHAQTYYIVYNTLVFLWIQLFFLHILSIAMSIFGVRLRKPYLMLPQLILLILRLGILIGLFCALMTFNFVGSAPAIIPTLLVFILLISSGCYLVSTVFAFRYVREKYETIQLILASTKSVHFKEVKRRK